eukprot:SAG31_NODE_46853_length_252_cov_1.379085_1_plen_29_part_10
MNMRNADLSVASLNLSTRRYDAVAIFSGS